MSWRCLQNVLKTPWRCLEDVLRTFWSLEDVWPRPIYWSWSRRLEDVFCRRMAKSSKFVLMKTSWRRLLKTKTKDVFKTSLRRLHQDECLVGYNLIEQKSNGKIFCLKNKFLNFLETKKLSTESFLSFKELQPLVSYKRNTYLHVPIWKY